MARESALWQRVRTARAILIETGHRIDLQRLENAVGTGHPDVEGCIDTIQVWIELKSTDRPARKTTPIRLRSNPKTRKSQSRWHKNRAQAGCKTNFVLLQVGEQSKARLYLIPGTLYDQLESPESELELLCCCDPALPLADMLIRATKGW